MSDDRPDRLPEGMAELQRQLTDYSTRFNQALAGGIAPAIRLYAEGAAQAVEAAAEHVATLAQCKTPKEAIERQQAFSHEIGEKFQDNARQLLERQRESGEALKSLVEEGLKEFAPGAGVRPKG